MVHDSHPLSMRAHTMPTHEITSYRRLCGCRRGAFYWESVVMLRKLALSCVLVFLSSSDTPQGVQVRCWAVS